MERIPLALKEQELPVVGSRVLETLMRIDHPMAQPTSTIQRAQAFMVRTTVLRKRKPLAVLAGNQGSMARIVLVELNEDDKRS